MAKPRVAYFEKRISGVVVQREIPYGSSFAAVNETLVEIKGNEITKSGLWLIMVSYEVAGTAAHLSGQTHMQILVYPSTNFVESSGDFDRASTWITSTFKYNEPIPSQGFVLINILPHELTSSYFFKLIAYFSGSGMVSNVRLFGMHVGDMESEGAFTAHTTSGFVTTPNNMVPFCGDVFLDRIYNRNYTGTTSDRYLAIAAIGTAADGTNEMGPIGFRLSHEYEGIVLDKGAYITIPRLHTYGVNREQRPFLTMLPFRTITDVFSVRLFMRYKGTNAVVTDSFSYSASLAVLDLEYFDNVIIGYENAIRGYSVTCPGANTYNDDAPEGYPIPTTDPLIREPWPGGNKISTSLGWSNDTVLGQTIWGTCTLSNDGTIRLAAEYDGAHGGTICRSINNGNTWNIYNISGSRRWACSAMSVDGKYQYIGSYWGPSTSDYGRLHRSSDYGSSWNTITPPISSVSRNNISSVSTSADGKIVLATCVNYITGGDIAHPGTFFVSSNYGTTWTQITTFGEQVFRCSAMSSTGQYQFVGAYWGRLYRSSDYGISWSEVKPTGDTAAYWNLLKCSSDGNKVIVGAQGGRLYCSSDGGSSWSETQPIGDISKNWINAAMSADGRIIAVSNDDTTITSLYYSSDGGATWKPVDRFPDGSPTGPWLALAISGNGLKWMGGGYKTNTTLYKGVFTPGIVAFGSNARYDVNKDGYITAEDVTAVINYLNLHGTQPTVIGVNDQYDVNNDGIVSPADVLAIITYIDSVSTSGVGDAFYFNNGLPITLNASSSPVFSLIQANWQLPNSSPLYIPEENAVKESSLYFYRPGAEKIATPTNHKSTISIHTYNDVYPFDTPHQPGNFQEKMTRSAFGSFGGGPYKNYRPPVIPISHFLVSDSSIESGVSLSACVRGQPPDMSYIWARSAPNREIGTIAYSAYPETRSGRNEDRFWVSFELASYHDYNEPSNDTLYTKSFKASGTGVYTGHSSLAHTTDASLLYSQGKIHTTNAWFYEFLFHKTNAALASEHSLSVTTNALLLAEVAHTQTTDAFLVFEHGSPHTTNALLLAEVALLHKTDALLAEEHLIDQTTDSLLLKTESLPHSTDANLYGVIQHYTDALLLSERALDHTTDASIVWTKDLSHSTDADLFGVLHQSTDALLFSVGVKAQTVNALILAEEELAHTTSSLLLKENQLSHSTDAYLALVAVHYTNALLQAEVSLLHTTDALLKIQRSIAHTTDAWIYGYKSQTVDALLQKIDIPKRHKTNALLCETHQISHTTDGLLAEEHDIGHTTDGLLHWETFGSGVLTFNGFKIVSAGDEAHREYTQDKTAQEINDSLMANWTRKDHGAYQYKNVISPRLKSNNCYPRPDDNPTEG